MKFVQFRCYACENGVNRNSVKEKCTLHNIPMYLIIHYAPFSYFFAFQIEILGTFMPNWEQFYAEREQKIFILLVQEPF